MKREQMTDDELVAHIELLEGQCNFGVDDEVQAERVKAMNYYNSRPLPGDEENLDRSKIISSDVYEVVEGLAPLVLKPFVSSDDIVKFNPEGPDDEEAAQQETDYINWMVTQRNDVFETLVSWVKTGLLQKNGVVKYWWDKRQKKRIETYYAMPDDLYASLIQDDNVTVIAHSESKGDDGETLHDFKIRVVDEDGQFTYCVVPPEEFRISRNATSVNPKKSTFVQHVTRKTISELREMGYEVEDDIADASSNDPRESPVFTARMNGFGFDGHKQDEGGDPSMRVVVYRETYLNVDKDGDGIAELRMVCVVGSTILLDEEVEEIPFCAWTPVINPFRFDGGCPADETVQIQLAKTGLIRNTLDNIYTANNNRTFVGQHVNLTDMVDNQIGGYIRVAGGNVNEQVKEASITPIGPVTLPLMELLDSRKENVTGFTRYNQGTDGNSLNKTATGIRIISEAGNERVGLISRSFAELGLKELMVGAHGLCRRYGNKGSIVRLRGKWVPIDPRDWKTRYDMSVSVGLGNSDKQMQMQGAQLLLNEQKALAELTGPKGIVSPQNLYNSAAKLAQSVGERNPEMYFTAPPEPQLDPATGQPAQEPPPNPMADPEVQFRTKEALQKDTEIGIKERELALKERELDLKERESQISALSDHARLLNDLNNDGVVDEKDAALQAEKDGKASNEVSIVESTKSLVEMMGQFMQSMAQSQQMLAQMLAESAKPKQITIAKQIGADGMPIYTGIRADAPETLQ